ncbi:MAG: DUF2917 domain-containing protein [Burkholderiaceae bacterium]
MNRKTLTDTLDGSLLDITAESVPLHAPIGSAIFAHRGTVWITQESLLDDVILQPGERFIVRSRALILVSATNGSAKVLVASPLDAPASKEGDVYALVRGRARRLRTEALGEVTQAAHAWLSRHAAHAVATVRHAIESLRRVPGH